MYNDYMFVVVLEDLEKGGIKYALICFNDKDLESDLIIVSTEHECLISSDLSTLAENIEEIHNTGYFSVETKTDDLPTYTWIKCDYDDKKARYFKILGIRKKIFEFWESFNYTSQK